MNFPGGLSLAGKNRIKQFDPGIRSKLASKLCFPEFGPKVLVLAGNVSHRAVSQDEPGWTEPSGTAAGQEWQPHIVAVKCHLTHRSMAQRPEGHGKVGTQDIYEARPCMGLGGVIGLTATSLTGVISIDSS